MTGTRWKYTGGNGGAVETEDGKYVICDSGDWGGLIQESDGKLMAAAPALADALEALLGWFSDVSMDDDHGLESMARSALRLAGRLR